MKILCVTHADFENPGAIEDWAINKNFDFKIIKPYKGESLSSITDYDCLIVMGGPQSANEAEGFPYLNTEIDLIKDAVSK